MKNIISIFITFLLISGMAAAVLAADNGENPFAAANSEFQQAEKDLQKAADEFARESNQSPLQQNGQTSWSQASAAVPDNSKLQQSPDSRTQPLQGSPETGYAGTWTDPANGDIVTTVIAPKPQQNQQYQNYPIIVEPQLNGATGNWGAPYAGSGLNSWPTTPDNPGYPVQNPPYNQPPPPGWHPYYPGQPYPGFNPYPYPFPQPYPGYNHPAGFVPPVFNPGLPGSAPPPFDPNYKPLRPYPPANNPGGIWKPGMTPPPGNGWNPGASNGIGWNPGSAPIVPPPNVNPAPAQPSVPALPLNPAGQSWHRSPFSPNSGGGGVIRSGSKF